MRALIRLALAASMVGVVALLATPALAQKNTRTGDGIVPSIETICDGDPFSFGLCNAYCEALDCEDPTPLGTPRACSNLLNNYKKKSGGRIPPCACPCIEEGQIFSDFPGDFEIVKSMAEADIPATFDPTTFDTYCANEGPNGELAFAGQIFEADPTNPQGARLYFWINNATLEPQVPASCRAEGGGLDGEDETPLIGGFWSYGPFLSEMRALTADEVGACQTVIDVLCPN